MLSKSWLLVLGLSALAMTRHRKPSENVRGEMEPSNGSTCRLIIAYKAARKCVWGATDLVHHSHHGFGSCLRLANTVISPWRYGLCTFWTWMMGGWSSFLGSSMQWVCCQSRVRSNSHLVIDHHWISSFLLKFSLFFHVIVLLGFLIEL